MWQALTDVGHQMRTLDPSQTVKAVMDTWTLQMGYPVVKVERSYLSDQAERVFISQERFLLTKDNSIQDDHLYR